MLSQLATLWQQAKLHARHNFRGGGLFSDAQGGYVHDTNMSQLIPVNACLFVTGTWTPTAGAVTGTWMMRSTAAAQTVDIVVPIAIPQNAVALKGAFLKSMDFWWIDGTASFTTMAATIRHATIPANAAAYPAVVSEAFAYDTFHATAGNRITAAQHTMTLTPTTPWWLSNTDQLNVQLDFVNPGTAVLDFYGARANFTLRM